MDAKDKFSKLDRWEFLATTNKNAMVLVDGNIFTNELLIKRSLLAYRF